MIDQIENPWVKLPAEDYEGHMSSANVMQLGALSSIFESVLKETNPKSILFLGCTTGNGFEHLNATTEIVGVDINQDYLEICKERFSKTLPKMKLTCADINTFELNEGKFDLVYAALVFEYVDVQRLLKKIFNWIKPGKYFGIVLQQESKTNTAISETGFDSVKLLAPIHNLVNPKQFMEACIKIGFNEVRSDEYSLPGEKRFSIITLYRPEEHT